MKRVIGSPFPVLFDIDFFFCVSSLAGLLPFFEDTEGQSGAPAFILLPSRSGLFR